MDFLTSDALCFTVVYETLFCPRWLSMSTWSSLRGEASRGNCVDPVGVWTGVWGAVSIRSLWRSQHIPQEVRFAHGFCPDFPQWLTWKWESDKPFLTQVTFCQGVSVTATERKQENLLKPPTVNENVWFLSFWAWLIHLTSCSPILSQRWKNQPFTISF